LDILSFLASPFSLKLDLSRQSQDHRAQYSMSGPAFGFSVGDFLTAGKLIVNITKALKEAGGASDEYRSLVQELGLLERILKRLQTKGGTGDISAVITQQANLTLATLSGFLKTISKFDAALGKQAPSAWRHGTGRKAQWAVAYAEDIEKFRVKVGTHLNQLNLLLQLQTNTRQAPGSGTLGSDQTDSTTESNHSK
jgi:hypothetical protein